MKKLDRLDILIDLSLNGEANEKEASELQELVSSSDEMMNHYFESIDQQLTFKQQFEDSTLDTSTVKAPTQAKSILWFIIPLVSTILLVFFLNQKGAKVPQKINFTVSKESHDISILRSSKEIDNAIGSNLQNLDLVDVGPRGELWLKTENGADIYLGRSSQLRMEKKSTEAFQLLKGYLAADLTESGSILSLISRDIEIIADKARFSAEIKNNHTKICVMSGQVKLTRLKDGKSITLKANESTISDDFIVNPVAPEDSYIFPKLENGVNYYYFELKDGTFDENRLINDGIVNCLYIRRGQHEGYVRNRPDSHSDVSKGNFHILLKTNFKAEKAGKVYFKLSGRKSSRLSINGDTIILKEDMSSEILSTNLSEGFYPLQVHSPGILDKDKEELDLNVEYSTDGKTFKNIPESVLYHRNPHPLPDQFTENNINRSLSARLPLKGNFKDIINNQEAAPMGSPQFIKDPEFGIVCELDGKDDYLVHLPVDQLGMAQNYTASAWIKLQEGAGHYDQPLFANASGGNNATLVLLIRRMHPYLAHLHDDTVASEKLEHGKWAHVVFRYHNGEQAIFLNGKLAVNSYKHSSLFSNRPMLIGYWNRNRIMKGLLRDIRIYNTALSSNDIELLYEKTSKKKRVESHNSPLPK